MFADGQQTAGHWRQSFQQRCFASPQFTTCIGEHDDQDGEGLAVTAHRLQVGRAQRAGRTDVKPRVQVNQFIDISVRE